MPIDQAGLLAAVSAAVTETSTPPTDEHDDAGSAELDTESTGTPTGGEEPSSKEETGDEAPAGGETDIPAADAEVPEGKMRDAQGRFVAKTPENEAAAAAAKAAAKPVEQPKAKDPINDPIPQGLKKETGERIQAVIKIAKEQTQKAELATSQFNEVMGLIKETRATPEQYGQTLEFLKMFNSGDPDQLEKALVAAQQTVTNIARLLGKPVPGVDFLSGHQDLRDAVQNGEISQAHAEELAAARANRQLHTQMGQQHTQQGQAEQVRRQGISDLNALEVQLQASDPQFAAKRPTLLKIMQPIINRLPPTEWAAAVRDAYANIPAPVAAAPAAKPAVPGQQPFRGKNPAGGHQAEPKTLAEAIKQGIAQAR